MYESCRDRLFCVFSHIRPDGRSAFTALDYYGCVTGFRGENLAGGQRTPELVVKAWEESDKGHRELLLNPKVKRWGVATAIQVL